MIDVSVFEKIPYSDMLKVGTRNVIPISGKDSATTAILQTARTPDVDYEYIFNDTGMELPATYEWLDRMEAFLGSPIKRTGKPLDKLIEEMGWLPSPMKRYCTVQAKIWPMEDEFKWWHDATLYFGIRADEDRIGYEQRNKKKTIKARYPLQEMNIGLDGVYRILDRFNLMPPQFTWDWMVSRVREMLGDQSYLIDRLDRQSFARVFAWRSRPNCYMCFFQRRYEFIGLLEHYPELYWKSSRMEETIGGDGYTWLKGVSLKDLAIRADEIKEKRAKAIAQSLIAQSQLSYLDDGDDPMIGLINVTSCGLFCGK